MIGTPCLLSSRKNSTIVSTHARKRWERPEGEERASQVIACKLIEHAMPRQGKDGLHLPMVWWMGNIGDAFAAVPGLTPLCRVLLHTSLAPSRCLRSHYPPARAGIRRLAHSRRRTAERSCLMRDTREMEAR